MSVHGTKFPSTTNSLAGIKAGDAKVVVTRVDVSKPHEIEAWVQTTVHEFGRLDGAANVAGLAGGDGETTCATIVCALCYNFIQNTSSSDADTLTR